MNIALRKVEYKDASLLFEWANDPEVRKVSLNKGEIFWENHLSWLKSKLTSGDTVMLIMEIDDSPVGQIRFEKEDSQYTISYMIGAGFRGRGYGKEIVANGINYIGSGNRFRAFVMPSNIASINIFQRLGFIQGDSKLINEAEYYCFLYNSVL